MEDWLKDTVHLLVDDPDSVNIKSVVGESTSVLEVDVASEDIGKVIGVDGRTANALRVIMNCVGAKEHRRYILQING